MKLALQGHTIVVASGDYGVAGTPLFAPHRFNLYCISSGRRLHRSRVHKPLTPGTCRKSPPKTKHHVEIDKKDELPRTSNNPSIAYVTTVGGTRLYAGQTVDDPESVMQVNLTDVISYLVYTGEHNAFEYFSSGKTAQRLISLRSH